MTEREIFIAALQKEDPDQRQAYLDEACAGQPGVRQQIESLLKLYQCAGSFLEQPAAESAAPATLGQPIPERPGMQIGPYKLLQQIGEGGMGTVYMAEQTEPIVRRVALKIIKPGMDTRQVIARFEAERQALAMMDHVNIARVLDAGTTESGRPYFVMELVHGVPITNYCDDNHLTPRERLELFVPVCQAIQHAHQKGIIHRDIKPSNIMVTLYDGKPVPKVIDFGVAKATEQKLTERTLYTQYGTMVGTLEYMSPEQAEMSALGVDTRSDIYSLGVLLYELLTGSTPLTNKRMKEAAYAEILRMIKEEEPPKPSTRLSDSGEALASISANRHTEPAKLTKLVRGELDWIVMKTLEKDRNRRYETASSVARDVEHYLHHEAVEACPPSALYRFRKFARRNQRALATGAVAAVFLVTAVIVLLVSNMRIAREQERTQEALNQANAQRDLAEANFRKACQAVDDQFTLVSQSTLFEVPGLQPLRKDLLESALKYYQEFLRQRPNDPVLQAEVAAAYFRLYQISKAIDSGLSADAILALEKGVKIAEKLLYEHPDDAKLYSHLAGFAKGGRNLHTIYGYNGRGPRADSLVALQLFERAARIWEKFVRDNPTVIGFQFDLSVFYVATHEMQVAAGRPAEALASLRKAHAIREKIARENPTLPHYRAELAWTHDFVAERLRPEGRPEDIEKHYVRSLKLRQELVAECPGVPEYRQALAVSQHKLGSWLSETGRALEAEQAYRQALILQEKLVTEFPNTSGYHNVLAWRLVTCPDSKLRDPSRAVDLAKKAVQLAPDIGSIWNTLGVAQYRAGNWEDAVAALEKSMQLSNGGDSSDWFFLAMAHWHLGEKEQARKRYEQGIQGMEKETDDELRRELRYFCAEATELLGVKEKKNILNDD
jgi:serine/threonine protein kinase/tetratricopeptide (TPR) repeat protein